MRFILLIVQQDRPHDRATHFLTRSVEMNGMKCLRGSLFVFSMAIIIAGWNVVAKAGIFDACKPVQEVPPPCEPSKKVPVCERVKPVPPPCEPVKVCEPVKTFDQCGEKYPIAAAVHHIAYVLTTPLRNIINRRYETYNVEYTNTPTTTSPSETAPLPASQLPSPPKATPEPPTIDKA